MTAFTISLEPVIHVTDQQFYDVIPKLSDRAGIPTPKIFVAILLL